jgi:hypothetical protein
MHETLKSLDAQNLETLKSLDANMSLNERWGPPAAWQWQMKGKEENDVVAGAATLCCTRGLVLRDIFPVRDALHAIITTKLRENQTSWICFLDSNIYFCYYCFLCYRI